MEDKNTLNAIQYDALRVIYRKDRAYGNKKLLKLAQESNLDTRLNNLNEKYLCRAINTKNPLVTQAINEFKRFKNGRFLTVKTSLCNSVVIDEHQNMET